MSSWIPSLLNPFTEDEENENENDEKTSNNKSPVSGAKEDISAVFRGVAAFLAPPQTTATSSSSETISGIRNDLAEIQGSFRSGLSLISSKISSNFLQFHSEQSQNVNNDGNDDVEEDEDYEEESGVGITDEVVDFVSRISDRSELWTDFPLHLSDDFDLSDYQREHAANIDHLVPEFVTLRQKICSQISDAKFWLIYFILLLPRLTEDDSKLLSTPQVTEARATLLNKLQNKTDEAQETSEKPEPSETATQHEDLSAEPVNATKQRESGNESEPDHHSKEVDVSFSDLEDDVENDLSDKEKADKSASAAKDKESESEDWLTVDDTDFDNLASI